MDACPQVEAREREAASRRPLREAHPPAAATQRFQQTLAETRHADNWLEDQLQPPERPGTLMQPRRLSAFMLQRAVPRERTKACSPLPRTAFTLAGQHAVQLSH